MIRIFYTIVLLCIFIVGAVADSYGFTVFGHGRNMCRALALDSPDSCYDGTGDDDGYLCLGITDSYIGVCNMHLEGRMRAMCTAIITKDVSICQTELVRWDRAMCEAIVQQRPDICRNRLSGEDMYFCLAVVNRDPNICEVHLKEEEEHLYEYSYGLKTTDEYAPNQVNEEEAQEINEGEVREMQ
ncbi:hypothetical protein [Oceanidesulfovibrio marinus]|uniref:Cysteine rich repeat-containing protein n=1 Tax=Oceanidesulfovibrio marinus TaxID=370038 RepID=A0ABX6NAY2_9BACT|nr:hypothetical protein [Oceanidesulfovibrio marinus]QJT07747.1 hypothetical protein E8L03_01850 [Oceanidesulfovibrio marinus]